MLKYTPEKSGRTVQTKLSVKTFIFFSNCPILTITDRRLKKYDISQQKGVI